MTGTPRLADAHERALIRDTALDDTLVVEAAAGTGKTTMLVQRIVRVIATGRARIGEIAAVTFTEKAAGELKLRLREALEHARRQAGEAAGAHLDAALRKLEEAHVTTIHGFCADLLRERPVEAGIDPLFAVLTETQAARIFDGVFDRWLQEQLADPPEGVRRVLRRHGPPGTDDGDGPIAALRRAGVDLSEWRDLDGAWTRPAFARLPRIDALVDDMRAAADLLRDPASRYDGLHQSAAPLRRLVDDLARVEAVGPRDYDGLEAQLVSLSRHRDLQRLRKGSGATYKAGVARETVWQAVEGVRASLAGFEMDANADLAALLQQDLRGVLERYARAKAEAGAVDFLDLLLQARNLIRGNDGVRRSFQRRFARIFVDEFQDTDPLQAEILLLLVADDPAATDWRQIRPVPGKLFLVGDPKQSIYRFRRADVGVYGAVYTRLEAAGARRVTLRTSFRARPAIQRAINAAFAPAMTGDAFSQQPDYVPLSPARDDAAAQPAVVVLPVPQPYATQRVAASAIEQSLPEAVGAFVHWLVRESRWRVDVRGELVPIQPGHVCLLFRRFVSFGQDVTRGYVEALEARGVPHLLVGGRSFHNRAEVEALRAALAAVEWPGDELSVFAALHGPFFAIGDEELLQYRHRFGRFHPFLMPADLREDDEAVAALRPIADALTVLRELHQRRNRVPVAATIGRLLEATRVHVRFALEHGGEQVLANVLRVADLARQYEADGTLSFRGFLEELDAQAEAGRVNEAPILEEGSDGVRLMTVHKAKGLEFPVVILADMTAKLRPAVATRYLDPDRRLCAMRLAGCAPADLVQQGLVELERDRAEGIRVAYVAATRARDLLVVPAVGDEERDGWVETLNAAIYPSPAQRRIQATAPGCPPFRSKDSVLDRPHGEPAGAATVSPGLHRIGDHDVVWWDPRLLHLDAAAPLGLRHEDLIVRKDVPADVLAAGMTEYTAWRTARARAIDAGATPAIRVQTVTQRARTMRGDGAALAPVAIVRLDRAVDRPGGRRFGTLVHGVLASAPLDAGERDLADLAASAGRALGATAGEVVAAAGRVRAAFADPLFARARRAAAAGRCRREVPIAWRDDDGVLLEGVIDLAFEEDGAWVVVDFKTDDAAEANVAVYRRQLALYAAAVARATGQPVAGVLVYL
jgi:ATP-dependent exoDNAse (exonuclease V) beta subunit